MKIRSDYVTNSSSSSFIIGKKDDNSVTIESVFQTVKSFYKEYLSKRDALIEYITANPKLNIEYRLSCTGKSYIFDFTKDKKRSKKTYEIESKIEKDFGISIGLDFFYKEYNWLDCETYADYERYWIEKFQQTQGRAIHAPFTIADFLETKNVKWLHGDYNCEDTLEGVINDVNSESDVLDWYYPYIHEAFSNKNCEECSCYNWCDKEVCSNTKDLLEKNNIPEDKACLWLLGRVCIYSESGYIPQYVVEKLSKISEYSCNHMG